MCIDIFNLFNYIIDNINSIFNSCIKKRSCKIYNMDSNENEINEYVNEVMLKIRKDDINFQELRQAFYVPKSNTDVLSVINEVDEDNFYKDN